MCWRAASRRMRTDSPPASSTCGCRSTSSAPQITKEPTSMNSAAGAPAARPALRRSQGRARTSARTPRSVRRWPWRSASWACSGRARRPNRRCSRRRVDRHPRSARDARAVRATSARSSEFAASAAVPSSAASSSTAGSQKCHSSTASAAVAAASKKYSAAQLAAACGGLDPWRRVRARRTRVGPARPAAARQPRARCACGRRRRATARPRQTTCPSRLTV